MVPITEQDKQAVFREAFRLAGRLNRGKSYVIPMPDTGDTKLPLEVLLYDSRRANLGNCLLKVEDGSIGIQYVDISLPCLVGKLEIRRAYNDRLEELTGLQASKTKGVGLLGRGWVIGYETCCIRLENELTWLCLDDGKEHFVKRKEGWSNANPHSLAALIQEDTKSEEWTLKKSELLFVFSFDGRLKKISDVNRNYIELRYIGDTGLIQDVSSSCGKSLSFQYKDNKIVQITDNIGRIAKYFYDGDYLTQVERPNGGKYTFSYDKAYKKLNRVEDANGTPEFLAEFDRYGRKTALYKNSRQNWQISRDDRSRILTFSGLEHSLDFRYDRVGLITEIKRGGELLRYEYNEQGQMSARIDQDGDRTAWEYDRYDRLTETVYSNGGWERREYAANGQISKLTQDNGYEKTWEYDRTGNLITIKEKHDKGVTAVTQYERDARGRIVQKTDPNKNTLCYIYKTDNSLYPETTVYPNGYCLERQFDGVGRLIWEKNLNGETSYLYNNLNLPVKTFFPNGSHDFKRYDLMGRLVEVITPREVRCSGEEKRNAVKFRYQYDDEGLFTGITAPSGAWIKPSQEKEDRGNGEPGEILRYNYICKLVERQIPIEKDEKGDCIYQIIQYAYDKNTNPVQEKIAKPERLGVAPSYVIKTYTYDDRNNISRIHINSGEDRKCVYKGANCLVRETVKINSAKEYKILYEYNKMGFLAEKIEMMDPEDANGEAFDIDISAVSSIRIRTGFSYDEDGHLNCITLPDGSSLTLDYDEDGNRVATPDTAFLDKDALESQVCEAGAEEIRDKFDRVIKASWPDGRHEAYTYDYANNLASRMDADGKVTKYSYNSINKLKQIICPTGKITEFLYGPDGRLSKENEVDL